MRVWKATQKAPYPEIRGSLGNIQFPAFAEYKFDGEFNIIKYANGKAYSFNKYGTHREDFRDMTWLEDVLKRAEVRSASFLCEIFTNHGKLGELYNLLRLKKEGDALRINIFDIFEHNGMDIKSLPYIDRREILQSIMNNDYVYSGQVVHDAAEAKALFERVTRVEGYEGIVVKNFGDPLVFGPCAWVKMKAKDQNEYTLVDLDSIKERGEVAVPLPNGSYRNVGVKIANKYKPMLAVGDTVVIEHQGVLDTGGLRHPVFIKKRENGNGV